MESENIKVVRRWFHEVWNLRRSETIDELLTPESVCHADEGPLRGAEEFRERQHRPFLAAFDDLKIDLDGVIADGDQVVARWTATGTHRGDGLGFAATHRPIVFRGMTWIRVKDGKMMEGWQSSNIPEVIRSLAPPVPV